jgi:hypothetical protein
MAGSDWMDDIMKLALMYAQQRGVGGSGDTPNFYDIPLSPEQKRVEDAKWDLYKQGGSAQTKAVQGMGMQFLGQIPTGPTNFSFLSPQMQGQSFAGGMQFPKFDMSKLPSFTPGQGNPNAGKTFGEKKKDLTHGNPAGTVGPVGGFKSKVQRPNMPWDWESGVRGSEDIGSAMAKYGSDLNPSNYEYYFPTTGGPMDPNRPANAGGPGMQYGSAPELIQKATSWWEQYKAQNPNWAQLGVKAATAALAATFGLPGAIAGRILGRIIMSSGGSTPPPATGNTNGTIPGGTAPGSGL